MTRNTFLFEQWKYVTNCAYVKVNFYLTLQWKTTFIVLHPVRLPARP